MLTEMEMASAAYVEKWESFIKKRKNKEFFRRLKPTSIGWKTTDIDEFNKIFLELRDLCDQVHLGWINERWLASLHLKERKLPGNIEIVKLMQRRSGSSDPVGLDHLDFYAASEDEINRVLASESDIDTAEESNNPLCHWHSIRFDDTEAKLRADTVLEVCIAELKETDERLLNPYKLKQPR